MIAGVRAVAKLPDPVGRVLDRTELDTGLELEKVSCPIGLLAVIFEARPGRRHADQLAGDQVRQRRDLEARPRSRAHGARDRRSHAPRVGRAHGDSRSLVTNIQQRAQVDELLQLDGLIDLVIPRGSYELVRHVQSATRIPVLGHSEGVCHIYVDDAANFEMALAVIDDAKTDYPAACNAVETVLVHKTIAAAFLPLLAARMTERGVRLRGCPLTIAALPDVPVDPVAENEWHTEYGDLILAVKVVSGLDEAVEHIRKYGSAHTDAILTDDAETARRFLERVDSAGVFHNVSTRFSDGYRYGFGAEVGISTSRLHARGPVGLAGLTTYRYILHGAGQLAGDYQGPKARLFLHQREPQSGS